MTHLNESYVILFLSKVSVLHDVEIIIFKFKQYSFLEVLLNETTPFCIPFETAVVFFKNTFAYWRSFEKTTDRPVG